MSAALAVTGAGPARAAGIEAGGSVASGLHLGTECGAARSCQWLEFQDLATASGHVRSGPGGKTAWAVSSTLRLHTRSALEDAPDAVQLGSIQPLSLDIHEAWAGTRGSWLDITVGQQRLAWGVAYGVNPTDVVNPYDLRDPMQFDARLGVPAVAATVHGDHLALELVYVPLFRAARLPAALDVLEGSEDLFDFSDVGGADITVGQLTTRTKPPESTLDEGAVAVRASLTSAPADAALVAYAGRDPLPQVGGAALLQGFASVDNRVDLSLPVVYPRILLAGAEIKAPLFWEISGWFEGAAIVQEALTVTASQAQVQALVDLGILDSLPDPLPSVSIQDGEPYVRFAAGIERFVGTLWVSLQWVHGLPTERSAAEARDYGALAVLYRPTEAVQVETRGLSDGDGFIVGADLRVTHAHALTAHVGFDHAQGGSDTSVGLLEPMNNVHAGVELAF